jgi:hypothetical protein
MKRKLSFGNLSKISKGIILSIAVVFTIMWIQCLHLSPNISDTEQKKKIDLFFHPWSSKLWN